MRAVAALLVVFYHIESHFPATVWDFIYGSLFSRGHIGVDMFFVLSGFLMVFIRPRDTGVTVASRFFLRRVLRVWPSYVVATLLVYFIFNPTPLEVTVKSLLFLPFAQDPPMVLGFPTLFVGWTLNYEIYFYLICTALLLLPRRSWFFPALMGWALVTLVLLPLVFGQSLTTPPLETPAEKYPVLYMALVTSPIIWEFVMGAVIAVVIGRYRGSIAALPVPVARYLAIGACVLFAVLFVALDNKMEPLACGLPAALMVAALVVADMRGAWQVPRWLEKLGDISYSVYLLHPLWIFALASQLRASANWEVIWVAVAVIATLLSALFMHLVFERPLLRLGKRLLSR